MSEHLRRALFGAIGYGVGFAVDVLLLLLLVLLELTAVFSLIGEVQVFERAIGGLLLSSLAFGAAGAVAGAIGGYFVARSNSYLQARGFVWRSALAFGLAQGIFVLPAIFFLLLALFYDKALWHRLLDNLLLGLFLGAVFGALVSFILALLLRINHRQLGRVVLSGILGFGAGGALMAFVHHYFHFVPNIVLLSLPGAAGGAMLGHVLSRETPFDHDLDEARVRHVWLRRLEIALALVIGVMAIYLGYNVVNAARVNLVPLSPTIAQGTTSTHWQERTPPAAAPANLEAAALMVGAQGPQLAWIEDGGGETAVAYARQAPDGAWQQPTIVAPVLTAETAVISGAAGAEDEAHLVWSDEGAVLYSRCDETGCSPAVALDDVIACGAGDAALEGPAAAADSANNLTAVWQAGDGRLAYAVWAADEGPQAAAGGCVPGVEAARDAQLAAVSDGRFALVFTEGEGQVAMLELQDGRWSDEPVSLGRGEYPAVLVDGAGSLHFAWCGQDGKVAYADGSGTTSLDFVPDCRGRPALAEDGQGVKHLLWQADEFADLFGEVVSDRPALMESVLIGGQWTEPALTAQALPGVRTAVQVDEQGTLHAVWPAASANDGELVYRTQTPYSCDALPQTAMGQAMLSAVTDPDYLPEDVPSTYCGNRFEDILFAPNPVPESGRETADSVFHALADLVATAEHEALIVNMKWEKSEGEESPGFLIARAVKELYDDVQANPQRYPRGMNVRIVLGNVPQMQPFSLDRQVWHVLEDLRDAGLPALVDEELGWRVEVGKYRGSWPHSHVKMVVVDGKHVLASGFNIAHEHFPEDHPSELGLGMVDFGLIFSGPVAQRAMAAYDDIWQASEQVSCSTLQPPSDLFWPFVCEGQQPQAAHPPEVLKYEVQEGSDDVAFSLYRSREHLGADDALLAAIGAAEEKIDLFQVNFSLEIICGGGVVFPGLCTYEDNAPNYIQAVVDVVEEKRIPVRVLTDQFAAEGYENRVAVRVLMEELERRGLSDLIEVRYYEGRMHSKAILIDDQFLVVGSQNFHYSAWGESLALNEYSLATENAAAVEAYGQAFDYYWQNSIAAEG